MRESLGVYLKSGVAPATDVFFADDVVFDGPAPADLAADHDRYLYDEPES